MVTYRAHVGFLADCNPALIERNAAEFARMRDLLVSIESAVTCAKDGTIWESEHRERYDTRLADVGALTTGLSDGFGLARTALLRYADAVTQAKQHLRAGLHAEARLDKLVSSVATAFTRTAQQAEPMRRWEDIRDTTGFLDWVAEWGIDAEAIRDDANRAYAHADEAFSRARSVEATARQGCLAELKAAYETLPDFHGGDFHGGDFHGATDVVAQLIPLQTEATQARTDPNTHLPGSGRTTDTFFPGAGNIPVSPALNHLRTLLATLPVGVSSWHHEIVGDWSDEGRRGWITNNKQLIAAAATESGLPPDLIAAVAWKEVCGKPYILDDAAEGFRQAAESPWNPLTPEYLPEPLRGDPDEASYGPMAVQIRRGAEALGYDPGALTEPQRDEIRTALKDPAQNLFIASKHLADLKAESDFADLPAEQLAPQHYHELAARYNGGSNWQGDQAQDYGDDVIAHLGQAREALR